MSREFDREFVGARKRQRPRRIVAPQFGVRVWRGERHRVGEQCGTQVGLEAAHLFKNRVSRQYTHIANAMRFRLHDGGIENETERVRKINADAEKEKRRK